MFKKKNLNNKKIIWIIVIIGFLFLFANLKKEARPYTIEEFDFYGINWVSSRIASFVDGNPNDPAARGTTSLNVIQNNSITQSYSVFWDGGDPPSADGSLSFLVPNSTEEVMFLLKYDASGGTGSSGSSGCSINNINFISHSTYRSRQTDWKPPINNEVIIKKSTDDNFWAIVNLHNPSEGESIKIGSNIDGMKIVCYGTIRAEESSASAHLTIDNFEIVYLEDVENNEAGQEEQEQDEEKEEAEEDLNPLIYYFGFFIILFFIIMMKK